MVPDQPESLWHTIRPWCQQISLQIREVTSVSVTLVLKASLDDSHGEAIAALGLEFEEEDTSRRLPTVSDVLGRGLAIKVNGNHWQRVVFHVDDDEEEAIVIIYGLVPRKKYEVTLGIVASDENIRENVTTQPAQDNPAMSDPPIVPPIEHAPDSATSPSTLTPPTTPIRSSPPRSATQEERVAQLRKQLVLLNTERDDLASQLKLARRESQRTETALKSEIEVLKRASEKHASGEHRSRQKVLALQEAVKQASAAAVDIEQLVKEIEETMPALRARTKEVQAEHREVEVEAEKKGMVSEAAVQADKKMVAELQSELTGVCARLEKVTGKKEKLEMEVVPQLEERLQELRREIEQAEQETLQDDLEHGEEDTYSPCNVRNWVSPIRRPSNHQRPSFQINPPINSIVTSTLGSALRQSTFRSPRVSFKSRNSATLSPLLPSYDPNFSLRNISSHEEASTSQSRVSELKPGNTFHTPPRFQNTNYFNAPSFDYVVRRPSPNPVSNDGTPSRQLSLPTVDSDGFTNIESIPAFEDHQVS